MKRILPIMALSLMAGCTSTPEPMTLACTFPDSPQVEAPSWICDEGVDNYALTAVGYAKKSAAGIGFMKDVAASEARVQLSKTFQSRVSAKLNDAAVASNVDASGEVKQLIERVSSSITEQTLSGARIIKSRTSSTGALYVLVGMSGADYERTMRSALAASKDRDAELWQRFKEEKADQVLNALLTSTNKL
ncbi:LPP20 lipoprotein [Ferrimonas sediminum]|uniref:LPP20 lipoprotein n=1 Tax=Ferrimonas sediminum TaxID=718193 RepID=A0A1G8LWQ4_9GAMM|nr:LPP20 family lipoprotein [Ferrimonas sediminum]SDI59917.1 LPP20 lipoprotein [Ferrimonas sediminum]